MFPGRRNRCRVRKHLILTGYIGENDLINWKSNCFKNFLLSVRTSDSEPQRQTHLNITFYILLSGSQILLLFKGLH